MSPPADVEKVVEDLLRDRGFTGEIQPQLLLGAGGVALDSISLTELLLACEEHFDIVIASDLLAGEPLSVARLVECVQSACVA